MARFPWKLAKVKVHQIFFFCFFYFFCVCLWLRLIGCLFTRDGVYTVVSTCSMQWIDLAHSQLIRLNKKDITQWHSQSFAKAMRLPFITDCASDKFLVSISLVHRRRINGARNKKWNEGETKAASCWLQFFTRKCHDYRFCFLLLFCEAHANSAYIYVRAFFFAPLMVIFLMGACVLCVRVWQTKMSNESENVFAAFSGSGHRVCHDKNRTKLNICDFHCWWTMVYLIRGILVVSGRSGRNAFILHTSLRVWQTNTRAQTFRFRSILLPSSESSPTLTGSASFTIHMLVLHILLLVEGNAAQKTYWNGNESSEMSGNA